MCLYQLLHRFVSTPDSSHQIHPIPAPGSRTNQKFLFLLFSLFALKKSDFFPPHLILQVVWIRLAALMKTESTLLFSVCKAEGDPTEFRVTAGKVPL